MVILLGIVVAWSLDQGRSSQQIFDGIAVITILVVIPISVTMFLVGGALHSLFGPWVNADVENKNATPRQPSQPTRPSHSRTCPVRQRRLLEEVLKDYPDREGVGNTAGIWRDKRLKLT